MLEAQVPRAKELLRVAGLASGAVDALTCLPDMVERAPPSTLRRVPARP